MNVHVGRARNAARSALASCCGDLVVGGGIAADHLHVDRRGQAEIQNLVGDVGGFEEERDVGKLLVQALAQPVGVFRGGAVVVRLRARSGCRRRSVPMVGLSPNARLKPPLGMPMLSMMVSISRGGITWRISRSISAKISSVFSMRVPDGRAGVQAHLAGIDRGEEVAADEQRSGRASRPRRCAKPVSTGARWSRRPVQQRGVGRAHQLEAPVEEVVRRAR